MFVTEGNRYNVRGDIAFAQSIVETAWFNYPDYGQVRPIDNNFSGIGACDSCGNGFQFSEPLDGVRAQMQLLRNYADSSSRVTNIPDPPVPELWGSNPATAAYNFDHYFPKGDAPLWNNMGNGNWATAPNYDDRRAERLQPDAHLQRPAGQCPPDGLLFGPLTAAGPCPVSLRQPGRAIAATPSGGYYVLNGNGAVTAFNGAPAFGSPPLGRLRRVPRHRGDARRRRATSCSTGRAGAQVRVGHRSPATVGLAVDGLLPRAGRRPARSRSCPTARAT